MPTSTWPFTANGWGYMWGSPTGPSSYSTGSSVYVGGDGSSEYQTFYSFPTTGLTADPAIQTTLRIFVHGIVGTFAPATIIEARFFDWASLDLSDWRLPSALEAAPLIASFPASSLVSGQFMELTVESALLSLINRSSPTRIML